MNERYNNPILQLIISGVTGFLNGTVIAVLMLYLSAFLSLFFGLGDSFPVDLDPHTLGSLFMFGSIFGGAFAAVVFPVFHFIHLKKVPFWRMWRVTFPVVLFATSLGWTLFQNPPRNPFIGGYTGSLLALIAVTVYFKWRDRKSASGNGPSNDPSRSGATEAH